MNIHKKVIDGFFLMMLGQLFEKIIHVIAALILARLLLPEDFGIIATVYIFIKFIIVVSGLGLSEAIVQRHDIDEEHLSTIFVVYVSAGLFFCPLTYFCAPFIALYFNNPVLTQVLKVLSFSLIFESMTAIYQALMWKRLDFKRLIVPNLVGALVYGCVGIIFAFFKAGYWSLVWASFFRSVIIFFIYWNLSQWQFKVVFKFRKLMELFKFSINVLGMKIMLYVGINIDYLIIAKYLGNHLLGFYYFAYEILDHCNIFISNTLHKVLFPTLSKISNKNELIQEIYLKIIQSLTFLIFPIY